MKTLFGKMNRFFGGSAFREREKAYLNEATSIVDLELRMREIEHGRFRDKL